MELKIYFKSVLGRRNEALERRYKFFHKLGSPVRLIYETFFRKNMGERYFSMHHVHWILTFLIIIPLVTSGLWQTVVSTIMSRGYYRPHFEVSFGTWVYFGFLGVFYWFARIRAKETYREPNTYDVTKHSFYAGDFIPFFQNFGGVKQTQKRIETVLEPMVILIAGILVLSISKPLAILFIISSFFYRMGAVASHYFGDIYVLDKIDDFISKRVFAETFLGNENHDTARLGIPIPNDPALCRKIVETEKNDDASTVE